jgi:uncharacterized protein (TIGR03086 family)
VDTQGTFPWLDWREHLRAHHGPVEAGHQSSSDPYGAWSKVLDQTLEALDKPGALQSVANEPFGAEFGSFPLDGLIGFMVAELVPHTWDLARTAKVDDRLDEGLCKVALATWKSLPSEMLRSPDFFGPETKAPKGADAQTRLLLFLGRSV